LHPIANGECILKRWLIGSVVRKMKLEKVYFEYVTYRRTSALKLRQDNLSFLKKPHFGTSFAKKIIGFQDCLGCYL